VPHWLAKRNSPDFRAGRRLIGRRFALAVVLKAQLGRPCANASDRSLHFQRDGARRLAADDQRLQQGIVVRRPLSAASLAGGDINGHAPAARMMAVYGPRAAESIASTTGTPQKKARLIKACFDRRKRAANSTAPLTPDAPS